MVAPRPIIKYPWVIPEGASGQYSIQTQWNGIHTQFFITLSDEERYWLTGDCGDGSMVTDLVKAIERGFHTLHSIGEDDFSLVVDPSTQVVAVNGTQTYELKWETSTFPGTLLGFDGTDVTVEGGGIISASYPVGGTWLPSRRPSIDTYDVPGDNGSHVGAVSGKKSVYSFDDDLSTRSLTFRYEPRTNVIHELCSDPSGSVERLYSDSWSRGRPIRYYESWHDVTGSTFKLIEPVDPTLPYEQEHVGGIDYYRVFFDGHVVK